MNKEYNNLTEENLVKTDWINQFDGKQKEEIRLGLEQDLDVSIYSKSNFNAWQMEEIREGLKEGLDVSLYAKSRHSWKKMRKIRTKLLKERKNNEQNT